jgi:hypothetical protein
MNTSGQQTYEVQSFNATTPERIYVVRLSHTGRWSCSCPAFTFFRAPRGDPDATRTCKHIAAIAAQDSAHCVPFVPSLSR